MTRRVAGASAFLLALLALLLMPATGADACGIDTDCRIGDRTYRVRLPPGAAPSAPVGAIVFAHGHRGTAAEIMEDAALAGVADRLGVALIAVKSAGDGWALRGAPSIGSVPGVDELAYFDAVLADVTARFPIDRSRLMATGFSAGAMMVWTLACHRPSAFTAFVAIAGTFWRPIPESCEPPAASILHLHGRDDAVVPLEGRVIGRARQGSVTEAVAMYARFGGFGPPQAASFAGLDCIDRRARADRLLRFCLYDGGHDFDRALIEAAWRVLAEARGR